MTNIKIIFDISKLFIKKFQHLIDSLLFTMSIQPSVYNRNIMNKIILYFFVVVAFLVFFLAVFSSESFNIS